MGLVQRFPKAGRFAVIDGFSPTLPPTFDPVYFGYDYVRRDAGSEQLDLVPNVFHLYKLHGSINWEHQPKTGEIVKKSKPDRPLLIYPRSNKYELAFAQPCLEMMSAFQGALREPNTGLLVIGFGFNDNHLAEPILGAIRSNLALKVAIVTRSLAPTSGAAATPGPADTNPHLKKIQGYIDHGDARLALIEAPFEDMIAHLPDLTSETELEKHMERVRKVMGPGA